MADTSGLHRPAEPCGDFTRFPRCYLFRIVRENRRLKMENA